MAGGAVGDDDERPSAAPCARATMGGPWLGLRADFARVFECRRSTPRPQSGGAFIAARAHRPRFRAAPRGSRRRARRRRSLRGPRPGRRAVRGRERLSLGAGLDGRRRRRRALRPSHHGARRRGRRPRRAPSSSPPLGALEIHDPCNCVVVRATAAHRIGREGIDAWVTVDLSDAGPLRHSPLARRSPTVLWWAP